MENINLECLISDVILKEAFEEDQKKYQALANLDDENIDQFGSECYDGRKEILEQMSALATSLQIMKQELDRRLLEEETENKMAPAKQ